MVGRISRKVTWYDVDQKLTLIRTRVHRETHIQVDAGICEHCPHLACVYGCPATCYRVIDGKVKFAYDGCVECGTCAVICDRGAVSWTYPQGGYGVKFRLL